MNVFNGIITLFKRSHVKVIPSDISAEEEKQKEGCVEICETDKAQVEQKLTVDESVSLAIKHIDTDENGMENTRFQTDTKVKKENPVKMSSTGGDVIPSQQTELEKHDENKSSEDSKDSLKTHTESLLTYLLNNPAPEFMGHFGMVSYFGFSMQGYSHSVNNIKCQDKCAIRAVGLSEKYVVAGIADGLGSCAFSDEGASVAVSSALDEIEKSFSQNEKPTDDDIIDILKHSMRTAYESVGKYADQKGKEFNEYYSTLTVVIYNGRDAFVAHAGDDGVVVLADSGYYGLVTTRHKGDTVNSVVPLQGETNWEFMIVRDIVGVVMATDGVLDAFVKREKEENRVFFPFVQILTKPEHDKKATLEKYKSLFKTGKVQENITDDITFMTMVNDEAMKKTEFQPFDKKEWFKKNRERSVSIYKALYPDQELTEDMAESWLDRDKVLLFALEELKML